MLKTSALSVFLCFYWFFYIFISYADLVEEEKNDLFKQRRKPVELKLLLQLVGVSIFFVFLNVMNLCKNLEIVTQ